MDATAIETLRDNFTVAEDQRDHLLRCWIRSTSCQRCLAADECSWCPFVSALAIHFQLTDVSNKDLPDLVMCSQLPQDPVPGTRLRRASLPRRIRAVGASDKTSWLRRLEHHRCDGHRICHGYSTSCSTRFLDGACWAEGEAVCSREARLEASLGAAVPC